MAITLDLSPELESKARRAAANDGIPLQEIIERALERMTVSESPALQKSDSSEADPGAPSLWELRRNELQAMWDAQPKGTRTNYSELEESVDFPEENRRC